MYSTGDFKKGLKVEIDGTPYVIVDFLHVKPGKGGAFVRTKLRNIRTGAVTDKTFRAGERMEQAFLERKPMQYTYTQDDEYVVDADGVVDVEFPLLGRHLGVEQDLAQQVAQFLAELVGVALLDGLDHLVGLLDEVGLQ